jgi:uncharacterized protein
MAAKPTVDESEAILHTSRWIESMVIGLNLCPFARHPFINKSIRYQVVTEAEPEIILLHFARELFYLDQNPHCDTTLILLPGILPDFLDYLDILDLLETYLENQGYEGIYQVASFHPAYQFQGNGVDDVENYTNRSPYPMFHLIREDQITEASKHHPNLESIPGINRKTLQKIGLAKILEMRKQSME